jgi:hypothetical protein
VSFFIQAIVGIGYMRNACSVYAGAGTLTDPWRAQPIGDPSSSFTFTDADDGVGVFSTAIGMNPVGFSPYGDTVTVKSKILEFSAGYPDTFVPLTPPPSKIGTIWGWFVFPTFDPTLSYALVFVPDESGVDHAIFALAIELNLQTKNPHFP